MEWVETTGKTVDEAKDLALDQLGVDEHDAEFEILEEPRTGLFGRLKGEARVRARVRPTQPRPKVDRRDRKGRAGRGRGNGGGRDRRRNGERAGNGQRAGNGRSKEPAAPASPAPPAAEASAAEAASPAATAVDDAPTTPPPPRRRRSRGGRGTTRPQDQEPTEMTETEQLAQGEVVRELLLDLLDAFELEGEVTTARGEDGAVELSVTGQDLGLLIGPKGQTLQAVQELARTVAQRHHPGDHGARIRIDVAGYRQRRREALERFVRQVAEDVKATGVQKALEPMSPPDRKVVHDTVNTIDGVHTISEGENDRRRVVIIPD